MPSTRWSEVSTSRASYVGHELEIALKYLRKFAAIKNRPADPAPTASTEDMI